MLNNKPIFNGLLHTGLPDMDALYGMGKIPLVNRTSYPGWTDPLGIPTAQWYDALAANFVAPRGIVLIDHESWPYGSQADRVATAQKYVTLYNGVKAVRPDLRIGWYMDPIRRDFWRSMYPRDSVQYQEWQAENTDLGRLMGPITDVYCPSLYFFYVRSLTPLNIPHLTTYLEENIREAQRIRWEYGKQSSPIYPYVWWMRHTGDVLLDADVWETIVRVTLEKADGMVLWGGWQEQWNEYASWWITVKARLTCKTRQQPESEGILLWPK